MLPVRSALSRLVAGLLLVVFPAVTAAMPLTAPAAGAASADHATHHKSTAPHQHPGHHQQCCDVCGVACGGCAGVVAAGQTADRPVLVEFVSGFLGTQRAEPLARFRLLPFPLGPPALLG